MHKNSYRALFKSSFLIGGAQVIFLLAGLLKMKVAAVLLGPVGIGLVGLYINLMQASATVAALGVGHAGTKHISTSFAQGNTEGVENSRQTLYSATLVLALIAGAMFWLCSDWIALYAMGSITYSSQVKWLSIGVALTIAAGGQASYLTGLRRVSDLARVSMNTGVISAIISIFALWLFGESAVMALVLAVPTVAFIFGHLYASRLKGEWFKNRTSFALILDEFQVMCRIGLPFMAAGLATLTGPLLVRTLVQRELDLEAAGQFQAAWSISFSYMGLVLGVMTSDFHPRLAGIILDKKAATQLVNEQLNVAVSLCTPILLLLIGLAPWVIRILYTSEFEPAVTVLRWQILGDALKVISFPLGFVLLASGKGKLFFAVEAIGVSVFVFTTWLILPFVGINATGLGFLMMYIVYLPLMWFGARRLINFHGSRLLFAQVFLLIIGSISILILSFYSELLTKFWSITLALSVTVWSLVRFRGDLRLSLD